MENNTNDQLTGAFHQIVSAHSDDSLNEINLLIESHNEMLRVALQEHTRLQTSLLLDKYESSVQFVIEQTNEEIAEASRRNVALQCHVNELELQIHAWQIAVRENQALITSLNCEIERLRETAAANNNGADDAESWCGRREERTGIGTSEQKTGEMICKCCDLRTSCVVMVPCGHLCSCMECDPFLDLCPVCKMEKTASIEALI